MDYKKSSTFAASLKEEAEKKVDNAASDFSRTKTITEQREYLPVFTVRDELITIVRENQIVVVVGETGGERG